MAYRYFTSISLEGNEIINVVLERRADPPIKFKKGSIYYNTVREAPMYFNGDVWLQLNEVFVNRDTDPDIVDLLPGQGWFNTTTKTVKYFDGTNVITFADERILQEVADSLQQFKADLASTDVDKGASMIGINDPGAQFLSENVEGALEELALEDESIRDDFTAADETLSDKIDSANAEISELQEAVGSASGKAGLFYSHHNYVADGDPLNTAVGKLDAGIKTAVDHADGLDFQDIYDHSVPTGGRVEITMAADKDLTIKNVAGETIFDIDSNTGKVTIAKDLDVKGSVTEVNSVVTDADHLKLSPNDGTTSPLVIEPNTGVKLTAPAIDVKTKGGGESVFTVREDGTTELSRELLNDRIDVVETYVTGEVIPKEIGTYYLAHPQVLTLNWAPMYNGAAATDLLDYEVDLKLGKIKVYRQLDADVPVSYLYHPAIDTRNVKADGEKLDSLAIDVENLQKDLLGFYDVAGSILGFVPAVATEVMNFVSVHTMLLEENCPNSQAVAKVAPEVNMRFELRLNGLNFGSITFLAGSNVGTFISTKKTIYPRDVLTVVSPDPPLDLNFRDVEWTFATKLI